MTNRAERIVACAMAENLSKHPEKFLATALRAIVLDFPEFRTAASPNDWEKGYHCVLDTLWDIATEIEFVHEGKSI